MSLSCKLLKLFHSQKVIGVPNIAKRRPHGNSMKAKKLTNLNLATLLDGPGVSWGCWTSWSPGRLRPPRRPSRGSSRNPLPLQRLWLRLTGNSSLLVNDDNLTQGIKLTQKTLNKIHIILEKVLPFSNSNLYRRWCGWQRRSGAAPRRPSVKTQHYRVGIPWRTLVGLT